MCLNFFAIGWPMHAVDYFARAQVPKANPSLCSLLSSLQSNNSVFDFVRRHAESIPLISHAETNLFFYQYRIHQT